ncbi:MAG: hypothetical protein ACXWPM_08720, partial [Bdellovibrionota bacterium]
MKRFAILILAQLILNVPAMADEVRGPIVSVCEGGFRQDSYGRGLNGGFINDDLRPHKLLDEACYELGEAQGRDVKARLSQAPATYDCENDFLSGRSKAIRGEFPQTGGECFVTGFQAGQAA